MLNKNLKKNDTDVKAKPNKKLIVIISSLVAVVLAVVLIFVFCFENIHKSPETVTKAFVEAYLEADADDFLDSIAFFTIDELYKAHGAKDIDELEDIVENLLLEGSNDLANYKIEDCKLNKDYPKDEIYDIVKEFGLSEKELSKIEDVAAVDVPVSYEEETENITFYCVKIDSEWYLFTF
ncbi:MAG: hypothetical protein E7562_05355 [Ruminococcaceae bacterium]|nr:hypothetical protein [Oscillospiraceae bacterium]